MNEPIGRKPEIQAFERLLSLTSEQWLMNIHGTGGVGKSALIDYYAELCMEQGIPCVKIDFSDPSATPLKTNPQAVLSMIADQLGGAELKKCLEDKNEPPLQKDSLDELSEAVGPEIRIFRNSLLKFIETERQFVLFFDGFENIQEVNQTQGERMIGLVNFLHETWKQIRVVISGRISARLGGRMKDDVLWYIDCFIKELEEPEAREVLKAREIDNENVIESILKGAKGNPFCLHLGADLWLQFSINKFHESLSMKMQNEFLEHALQELMKREDGYLVSHLMVTRYFNAEVIQAIFSEKIKNASEAKNALIQISRCSFVKKGGGFWYFHDLVREIQVKFLEDAHPEHFKKLNQMALGFYGIKFQETPPDNEKYIRYLLEYIYHQIIDDKSSGTEFWLNTFNKNMKMGNDDICNALLGDFWGHIGKHLDTPPDLRIDIPTDLLAQVNELEGEFCIRKEQLDGAIKAFENALGNWLSLKKYEEGINVCRKLASCLVKRGNFIRAKEVCVNMLEEFKKRKSPEDIIIGAHILTGGILREVREFDNALKYLNDGLSIAQSKKYMLYLVGTCMMEIGKVHEAMRNINDAVKHYLISMEKYQEFLKPVKDERTLKEVNGIIQELRKRLSNLGVEIIAPEEIHEHIPPAQEMVTISIKDKPLTSEKAEAQSTLKTENKVKIIREEIRLFGIREQNPNLLDNIKDLVRWEPGFQKELFDELLLRLYQINTNNTNKRFSSDGLLLDAWCSVDTLCTALELKGEDILYDIMRKSKAFSLKGQKLLKEQEKDRIKVLDTVNYLRNIGIHDESAYLEYLGWVCGYGKESLGSAKSGIAQLLEKFDITRDSNPAPSSTT